MQSWLWGARNFLAAVAVSPTMAEEEERVQRGVQEPRLLSCLCLIRIEMR